MDRVDRPRLIVFAQTTSAVLDVPAWSAHAERFFQTKLGEMNENDVILVAERGRDAERVSVVGTPQDPTDLLRAEEGERADLKRGAGMSALARRCATVFRVASVSDTPAGARAELLVAAILASVLLGPVVTIENGVGTAIFGVRGARERLTPAS